jgi:dipeptidyl aminopeptidase/acylaminoacyl peptidase
LSPSENSKPLPIPGEVFTVAGRPAFLITPPEERTDRPTPWVWYAPTLPAYPASEEAWMFRRFLDAGIAIAGIDVDESYGSPEGRRLFTALYDRLVQRGLSLRACLLARSRGGLMLYNWAAEHPDRVACVAGIYPVCNLNSYPGASTASTAYGLTQPQFAEQIADHNPIERLARLAEARVPIFHIHGDADEVVPLEANSAALEQRYRALGGPVTVRVIEGRGHDLWHGWFQCQELVDFVIANA